jgi:hypothetical protein
MRFSQSWPSNGHYRSFKVAGHDTLLLSGQRWTFLSICALGLGTTVKTLRSVFTFVTLKWTLQGHRRSIFYGLWKPDIDFSQVFHSNHVYFSPFGRNARYKRRCADTSDLRQFGPKTFRPSAEISVGHFGTGADLSRHIGPERLRHWSIEGCVPPPLPFCYRTYIRPSGRPSRWWLTLNSYYIDLISWMLKWRAQSGVPNGGVFLRPLDIGETPLR